MILGLGIDQIDIRRIEKTYARFGDRFLGRCFTKTERARALSRPLGVAATLAKRYAAKEACAKALGTGLNQGVAWRDMGVVNAPSGQPKMELTGKALTRLAEMTPPGWQAQIHISITDEFPYAVCQVLIEAHEKPKSLA